MSNLVFTHDNNEYRVGYIVDDNGVHVSVHKNGVQIVAGTPATLELAVDFAHHSEDSLASTIAGMVKDEIIAGRIC